MKDFLDTVIAFITANAPYTYIAIGVIVLVIFVAIITACTKKAKKKKAKKAEKVAIINTNEIATEEKFEKLNQTTKDAQPEEKVEEKPEIKEEVVAEEIKVEEKPEIKEEVVAEEVKAEEKEEVKEEVKPATKTATTKKAPAKTTATKTTATKKDTSVAKKETTKKDTGVAKKDTAKKETAVAKNETAKTEEVKEEPVKKERSSTYHVTKRKSDGKWQVKYAGGQKAIKLFDTQAQAIEYAKKVAGNRDGSVTVHKTTGQIRKHK